MNDPWQITLLGGLRAQQGERVITRFKTQKVAALFAYLAYHRRQAHSREILIELLWPESDAPTLRNSLSVALSSLRHQFEPPGIPQGTVIRADRFSVGLNPAAVETDAARFEQALQAASRAGSSLERVQHLTEAVERYQGPLLPGFYEEWTFAEQERLSGLFLDAVSALVSHLESVGERRTALHHARHAVAVDPLREVGQQHLIRLLAADGQPGAALRQYKEYERLLEEEVGDEPSAALRALFRRIEKEAGLSAPVMGVPAPRKHVPDTVPAGGPDTVTFLLTEIEGSTRRLQAAPEAYGTARETHHALLRREIARHGGREVKETGDGLVAAFPTAGSALAGAVGAQRALSAGSWHEATGPLAARMALHTGDVQRSGDDGEYHGPVLHHAGRMLTAAHGGQILVSDVTASLLQGSLEAGLRLVDLGLYRLRDVPEARRLFQVDYPGAARTEFGPLAAEAGHQANVPPRFTRFFGREREMEQLRQLLLSEPVRLVTVTGPGGTGKTRLSLEVAERLTASLAGAVYFCPLADLSDAASLPRAVLDCLRVASAPQREPLEQAVEALAKQPTLLVLDNFEHLVERGGADVVRTLLSRVSSLKLLVTSRQLLGLSAERELALSPLPVPGSGETPERLCLYDSVQLFIDRAQQVMPHFQVGNANAAAVAALVAGLEGIPLAIELAAARVQVLTPAQMLAQLSRRFDFLASRRRDVAERQRTLRGAVEWSYRLLTPELQRFFCRLSVFRGGWSVEAAEAVCEEPLALDYLEQLRECSLVEIGEGESGTLRFRMLETLREYGRERLEENREEEPLRHRHLLHFLALAEQGQPGLWGPEAGVWLDRFEAEHGNLCAALEWCRARSTAEAVEQELRLVTALGRFWDTRGYVREGRERLTRALARCEAGIAPAKLHAQALVGVGWAALLQRDWAAATDCFTRAQGMFQQLGIESSVAHMSMLSGVVARHRGDYGQAQALYQQALAEYQEIGGRKAGITVLLNLGDLAIVQGDYAGAVPLLEESLAMHREQAHAGTALVLYNLGLATLRLGDLETAWARLSESLSLAQATGVGNDIVNALDGLAALAAAQNRPLRVARLLGARQALYESADFGASNEPLREEEAFARAALGEETFAAVLAEGRTMTGGQAVGYALSDAD